MQIYVGASFADIFISLYFIPLSLSLARVAEKPQLEEADKQDLAATLSHNATLSCSKALSEMRGAKLSQIITEKRDICIKKKGREKCGCYNGDACDNYVGVFILFFWSLLPFVQIQMTHIRQLF